MKHRPILLASASPRRQELMKDMGVAFTIEPSHIEEVLMQGVTPQIAIEQLALDKAEDVFAKHPYAIVIGCDTMVVLDDKKLGKPKDQNDAENMLRQLSGRTHRVITGVALRSEDGIVRFHESTLVTFYDLDEDLLKRYIASDEPYDKAGAYGIQGMGKLLVKKIEGDYFNVMGLPVARLYRELRHLCKTDSTF